MGQSKARQGNNVLLMLLQATLSMLGDAHTRSLTELVQRLGVVEAKASVPVVPTEMLPPTSDLPAAAPAPPPGLNGVIS
jgi:hypothetical protein